MEGAGVNECFYYDSKLKIKKILFLFGGWGEGV